MYGGQGGKYGYCEAREESGLRQVSGTLELWSSGSFEVLLLGVLISRKLVRRTEHFER